MRELIRRLAGEGITILLSSHLLAEVEERLQPRRDRPLGARSSTRARSPSSRARAATAYPLSTTDDERALAVCRAQPGITDVRAQDGAVCVHRRRAARSRELSQALVEAGALIQALAPQTATLEDLFFSLTEDRRRRRSRAAAASRWSRST